MKLIIKTYWQKVQHVPGETWGKVLPEYELKSEVSYPTKYTFKEQVKYSRKWKGFLGVFDGAIKFDMGKQCGIHSYQLITIEN